MERYDTLCTGTRRETRGICNIHIVSYAINRQKQHVDFVRQVVKNIRVIKRIPCDVVNFALRLNDNADSSAVGVLGPARRGRGHCRASTQCGG